MVKGTLAGLGWAGLPCLGLISDEASSAGPWSTTNVYTLSHYSGPSKASLRAMGHSLKCFKCGCHRPKGPSPTRTAGVASLLLFFLHWVAEKAIIRGEKALAWEI
ncbi:hypothetical protein V8C86DRAFT_3029859 [Haematococcus lacustris]